MAIPGGLLLALCWWHAAPASGLLIDRGEPQPPTIDAPAETCQHQQMWPATMFAASGPCHIFLELPQGNQEAGLGHSFMSFNALVLFAARNNLTLRTMFGTRQQAHAKLDLKFCRDYFFGHQFWNGPRHNLKDCNIETYGHDELPKVESRVKEIRDTCASLPTKCYTMRLKGALPPNDDFINVAGYRRKFQAQNPYRRNLEFAGGGRMKIAMHLRRGDLRTYCQGDKGLSENRLVPNKPYYSLLKKLLLYLRGPMGITGLDVTLHCQGAVNKTCPDIDGETYDDFSRAFDAGSNSTLEIGSDNPFAAMDQICASDVVVTSKSGFSHLAAVLCDKPIFLYVPFWHSYDCIPNAMPLKILYGKTRVANLADNLTLPADFVLDRQAFHDLIFSKVKHII